MCGFNCDGNKRHLPIVYRRLRRKQIKTACETARVAIESGERMMRDLATRGGIGWRVLPLLLLALASIASEHRVLRVLTRDGSLEAELQQSAETGYYERLLDTAAAQLGQSTEVATAPGTDRPGGFVPFTASGIPEFVPSYQRARLKSGLDTTWNGTRFRTNRRGYRGPEIDVPKPTGTWRVVVLGSSNTLGYGVEDEQGYVRLLERWLQASSGSAHRLELVNLAMAGETPSQHLWRLQTEVEALEPDWILCDATAIDVVFEERHLQTIVSLGLPVPLEHVRVILNQAGVTREDDAATFSRKLRPHMEPLLDGTYAGWAAEAQRLAVPLTVLLLPRADGKQDSPHLFDLCRSTAARHGLELIDLSRAFDHLEVEQFQIGPWNKHPSVAGHQAIFGTLQREIERRGLPAEVDLNLAVGRSTRRR